MVSFKKNLELHIKSSDAVLENQIPVADGIKLSAFSEKGYMNATTSNNFISGCVSPIISYLNCKLLNCTAFSLNFFRTAHFVWNCTLKNPWVECQ